MISCLGGAGRVARVNPSARILLPEGGDDRVREAAKYVTLEGLANVELITEVWRLENKPITRLMKKKQ